MPRNVVVLGGGGGAGVVLAVLPSDYQCTAVIAVTDTGRSTGLARHVGGDMPAPGDVRSTIAATAQNQAFAQLLQHRFDGAGVPDLAGMALGNLMLAAAYRQSGDFAEAVAMLAQMADCRVAVFPVAAQSTQLCARLIDGSICTGELAVRGLPKAPIAECWLEPQVPALPAVVEAILRADEVIIGPGSFYTTLHAVLLPDGVRSALHDTAARVTFVANTTTQSGQTEHLDIVGHVTHLLAFLGSGVLDAVIVNTQAPSAAQIAQLADQGLAPLTAHAQDIAQIQALGVAVYADAVIEAQASTRALWNKQDTVRHDIQQLRRAFGSLGIIV